MKKTRKVTRKSQKGKGQVFSIVRNSFPSKEQDLLKVLLNNETTIEDVKKEIEKGADPKRTLAGKNLLHYLADDDTYSQKVEFLLKNYQLDPNQKDFDGWTPFTIAVLNQSLHIIELLVSADADLDGPNANGETPLWMAANQGLQHSVDVLVNDYEAFGDTARNDGLSAIDAACLGDPQFDRNNVDYMETVYIPIIRNLCKAGAQSDKCSQFSKNIRETNVGNVSIPKNVIVNTRTGEREPTQNAISYDPIQNGNLMVNFHNELSIPRFYKKSSFNAYRKMKENQGLPVTNPFNPSKKINSITVYTARLRGGKKTRRRAQY